MVRNKVAPVEDGANIQRNFEPPPPYTTPTDSPEDKIRSNSTATTASQPEFQGCWTIVVVAILFIINLLNYMDRYTIAGVLNDVQTYYNISDAWAGLIQTTFMVFFIIFSPICGFLGDRYNRKWIFVVGIAIWVSAVFASTFIPSNQFWLFLLFRGIVGIGEASYAIISPTVIADMFTGVLRSRMLMVFYFAIPFGCGLGFVVGSAVASWTGHWQWGVRVTGVLGIVCLLLIIVFVREPERGKAEREKGEIAASTEATSYLDDMKDLLSNATYVTSSLGYTATVFMVGTLAWWAPITIQYADSARRNGTITEDQKANINLVFGALTCVGGVLGVAIGTLVSNMWSRGVGPFKHIQTVRADALVCAIGAAICIPTLILAIQNIESNMNFAWGMLFICIVASSFNWATNVDLLLSVVVPQRRSSASSWQILISHMFGDASGPYILGLISDAIRGNEDTAQAHYKSLVTSFWLCVGTLVLSVILFGISAITVVKDKARFNEIMLAQANKDNTSSGTLPIEDRNTEDETGSEVQHM
ncbi:Major facilitator superfamily (MFS) profile domain-containing protein [Caenorhabditis elegans]|uniref:Major facilitator superfamily (MFS) profile domain-containing protein n=1 Tax=Caenorhabditis elegans TaxID=6239 RepID=O01927_CAEEL|nr:Major facilitator superfamily (MFS) profile domain-containing protein [Caenorhabditis elegans]CAB07311.1 Major facilitator superfamily (MFS) profile domain-containing protein [Caenorhabditis elegans]|eukprot:NP_506041.1 SPINster (Drosophila lysosomal permease) homolog [Caenorhabditis elegans]